MLYPYFCLRIAYTRNTQNTSQTGKFQMHFPGSKYADCSFGSRWKDGCQQSRASARNGRATILEQTSGRGLREAFLPASSQSLLLFFSSHQSRRALLSTVPVEGLLAVYCLLNSQKYADNFERFTHFNQSTVETEENSRRKRTHSRLT